MNIENNSHLFRSPCLTHIATTFKVDGAVGFLTRLGCKRFPFGQALHAKRSSPTPHEVSGDWRCPSAGTLDLQRTVCRGATLGERIVPAFAPSWTATTTAFWVTCDILVCALSNFGTFLTAYADIFTNVKLRDTTCGYKVDLEPVRLVTTATNNTALATNDAGSHFRRTIHNHSRELGLALSATVVTTNVPMTGDATATSVSPLSFSPSPLAASPGPTTTDVLLHVPPGAHTHLLCSTSLQPWCS